MVSSFAGNATGQERIAQGHTQGLPVRSFELDTVGMGAGDVWSHHRGRRAVGRCGCIGNVPQPDLPARDARHPGPDSRRRLSGRRGLRIWLLHGQDVWAASLLPPWCFIALNAWFPDDDRRLVVLANDDSIDSELVIKELLVRMFPLPDP